ncbi:hypothetical protein [Actinotignum schaalii]|uniref:hypothetical protein n=1 Tax=Actinotignum schaalii TaxID=59505 RepID=UPI0011DE0C6B|nr:hypothetical protein [Actinotignum schaalii]WQN44580.1 hypothetical protein U4A90_06160 [Actinotignum schaalii]
MQQRSVGNGYTLWLMAGSLFFAVLSVAVFFLLGTSIEVALLANPILWAGVALNSILFIKLLRHRREPAEARS